MSSELRFDGRVAIVTGAGNGLGRSHALLLGSRGCKVVVNDLGGSMHGGGGGDATPAQKVVAEIKAMGGDAVVNADSVEAGDKIVQTAMDTWGRVDIIVNNAGILRDVSFQKMSEEDWDLVYRVHVLGAMRVTKAAWPHMRDAKFGRIVMTASAAGIYGNFGQANYAMAKMGLIGFAQTLALEGKKNNVVVNTIAPIAASRLTETVLPPDILEVLRPEVVSPLVAYLSHESCSDTGGTYEVGGGFMAKIRWERSQGKTFANGRPITIEQVQKAWAEISGFDKTSHPANIAESMQPVLDNAQKKSLGGNELIDCDQALGWEFPTLYSSYDQRDLMLYALSVGAAENPLDAKELPFVYEMSSSGFQGLPSYAATPAVKAIIDAAVAGQQAPGLNYGFERILHGEQYTVLHRPLPPSAKLVHKGKIKEIWDKGKNAVVVIEMKTTDDQGTPLFDNEISMFVRGAGGWGGERGPASDQNAAPERAPDQVIEQKTDPNQALLFRLNGDNNPLHADPNFAKAFGFDKPILHGLCTFGYSVRHAILAMAGGDARLFKSVRARFADTVFPGETIVTELWKEGGKILLRAKVKERDKVVLSNTAIELYDSVPAEKPAPAKAAAAPAPAQAAAPAAAGAVTSALLVDVIGYYIEKNPELAGQVKTSFQFKLSSPDSAFYIDLKDGKGKAGKGELASPDVTLELSDADFIGMATGKLNPQKLYFGGQLKIGGNVMASQKLEFMKKLDGEKLLAQMAAEGRLPAAASAAPAAAAAPAASGALTSADIFVAIGDYVAKNKDLASQVKTSFQFELTGPDSSYFIDLKSDPGKVAAGKLDGADCTLTLSDADFLDMTTGKADPQKLYFAGKLKIGGNVMASQKLMFLKKVDPKAAEAAIAAARSTGGGAAKAEAAAAPKAMKAPGIFAALGERFAKEPALAGEIGAKVAFIVDGKEWLVEADVTPAKVHEGTANEAKAIFTISDADLVELCKTGSPRELFQRGKLRVDGEYLLAHRLGIMKGLVA